MVLFGPWGVLQGSDTLVGSALVDMSNFLNQGPFTLSLSEGKKAKGELDMVLSYLLPGLLTTEAPADTTPRTADTKAADPKAAEPKVSLGMPPF